MPTIDPMLTTTSPETAHARWHPGAIGPAWYAAVAALLGAAVYLNALHNPFVFDDRTEILENGSIRELWPIVPVLRAALTRPLVNLSYALDFHVTDLDPFGYHLTNVGLHVLNVVLLFALTRRFLQDSRGFSGGNAREDTLAAFGSAALFAVHPMMTEAVGYISGRAEVLSTTLFLAAVLAFREALVGAKARWLCAAAVLSVAALASKETAIMLPVVVVSYDLLVLREVRATRFWRYSRVHVPLFFVLVAAGAARMWFYITVEHGGSRLHVENLLTSLHVMTRYVSLLIVPVSQSIVHPVTPVVSVFDPRVATALVAVGTAVFGALTTWRRQPLIAFGLVWFLSLLVPSAALIVIGEAGQPMAEHRVYLASCGLFIAIASAGAAWLAAPSRQTRERRLVLAACGVILAVFGGLTIARNQVWSDPVGLWADAAQKAPLTYMSQLGLGDAYRSIGDCESARPPLERAITIRPEESDAYVALADCLQLLGEPDQARVVLRIGKDRVTQPAFLDLALSDLEESRQNRAEALRLCREALASAPNQDVARNAAVCVARNSERQGPSVAQ